MKLINKLLTNFQGINRVENLGNPAAVLINDIFLVQNKTNNDRS